MKFLPYIRYFYYIAVNWNVKIAWYIIKQEITGEKKYGIHTTGADELKNLENKGIDITHATIYMPTSYELLEEILEKVPSLTRNHFLDIGSGKGRALCVAAHKGFRQVTGIDFSKELCDTAKENLAITKQKISSFQYRVITNEAFYFDIPTGVDCIFFFNPFDEIIMTGVVNNLMESLRDHPREMTILYINPLNKELFIKAGFKETWHCKKMKYLEAVVLER